MSKNHLLQVSEPGEREEKGYSAVSVQPSDDPKIQPGKLAKYESLSQQSEHKSKGLFGSILSMFGDTRLQQGNSVIALALLAAIVGIAYDTLYNDVVDSDKGPIIKITALIVALCAAFDARYTIQTTESQSVSEYKMAQLVAKQDPSLELSKAVSCQDRGPVRSLSLNHRGPLIGKIAYLLHVGVGATALSKQYSSEWPQVTIMTGFGAALIGLAAAYTRNFNAEEVKDYYRFIEATLQREGQELVSGKSLPSLSEMGALPRYFSKLIEMVKGEKCLDTFNKCLWSFGPLAVFIGAERWAASYGTGPSLGVGIAFNLAYLLKTGMAFRNAKGYAKESEFPLASVCKAAGNTDGLATLLGSASDRSNIPLTLGVLGLTASLLAIGFDDYRNDPEKQAQILYSATTTVQLLRVAGNCKQLEVEAARSLIKRKLAELGPQVNPSAPQAVEHYQPVSSYTQ